MRGLARLRALAERFGLASVPVARPQLEMRWPADRGSPPDPPPVPPDYRVRQFREADREAHARLMVSATMGACPLDYWLERVLPDGFFVVEHLPTGRLVAACMASHAPNRHYERGGNLGWLAADPAHRGQNLGRIVATLVTERLVRAGYKNIYLTTDDERLAAISVYIRMGWLPVLRDSAAETRWRSVCDGLGIGDAATAQWPTA